MVVGVALAFRRSRRAWQNRPRQRRFGEAGIQVRKVQIWAVIAVIVALIALAVNYEARKHGFAWSRMQEVLAGVKYSWLAAACVISLATYVGRALRWRVLIRSLKGRVELLPLINATIIGFAAVTLLGRPGEFVRPYLIAIKEKLPFSSQLAAWFVERIYDLLVALVIFGYALAQVGTERATMQPGPATAFILRTGGWITVVACIACLVVLLGMRKLSAASREKLLGRLRFLSEHNFGRVEKIITAFLEGAASTKSGWATLQVLFWSVLEWVLIAGCYICIIRSFGDMEAVRAFSVTDVIIFMGFVSFGSLIQIPGIGGGVQVVAILVLTEIFGVPVETATSIAVLIWAITFALVLPLGVILALKEGITWATVKAAGREAIS